MSSGVKKSGAPCGPSVTAICQRVRVLRPIARADGVAAGEVESRLRCQAQHIAGAQCATAVAAELSERERGAAAEILRHVDAAAHGEIGALSRRHGWCRARARCRAAPRAAARTPPRRPSSVASMAAPASAITASQSKRSVAPVTVISSAAAPGGVAHHAIGEPERERIHRPRGRHADVPQSQASRPVLHGSQRAGRQHFDAGQGQRMRRRAARWSARRRRMPGARGWTPGRAGWSRCRRCARARSARVEIGDGLRRASRRAR